jgi:hypothetical protein
MRASFSNARRIAGAVSLFGLVACGSSPDPDLFRTGATLGGGGGESNLAGSSSAGEPGGTGGASTHMGDGGGASAGKLEGLAGAGGNPGAGGVATAGGAGAGGASGGSPLSDCNEFGADATYSSETQHCYLVVHELATFADAQAHCQALGAHLVTLADQDENDFAWSLNAEEHWIGANDGKGPKQAGQGSYAWVTGEPFTYTNWSSGQPNVSDTDCGGSSLTGHCYEHCAFQWTAGEEDGQWNDRFCLHTIASLCEWDSGHETR